MGCCQSSEPSPPEKEMSLELITEPDSDPSKPMYRVLMLGTGEGGKSTILMQVKRKKDKKPMYGDTDLDDWIKELRSQMVAKIAQLLIDASKIVDPSDDDPPHYGRYLEDEDHDSLELVKQFDDIFYRAAMYRLKQLIRERDIVYHVAYSNIKDQDTLDALGLLIPQLWQLGSVQDAFKYRGDRFNMAENMAVFFPRASEVMKKNFKPNHNDLLSKHIRTTGVSEYDYSEQDFKIKIIDVGAQRSERRKWAHHFDDISAVVYVVALNHYYAVLFEDESVNSMHESISVFVEYMNREEFDNSVPFLILNKKDLFEESLREFPLSVCFGSDTEGWDGPEYWEGPDYALKPGVEAPEDWESTRPSFETARDAAMEFIMDVFKSRFRIRNQQSLNINVMNATNDEEITAVFSDIHSHVILRNSTLQ